MTPDQQKDRDRLDRYIERESLAAIMNDTKWAEAIHAIQSVDGYCVQFRVRCLRDEGQPSGHWDRSFPHHIPTPYKAIEWIDINPVLTSRVGAQVPPKESDFRVAICKALSRFAIPYEELDDIIRIYGYKRPAKSNC